jgi:hypothetical protein
MASGGASRGTLMGTGFFGGGEVVKGGAGGLGSGWRLGSPPRQAAAASAPTRCPDRPLPPGLPAPAPPPPLGPPGAARSSPAAPAAPAGSRTCARGPRRTAAGASAARPASGASPAGAFGGGGWSAAGRCRDPKPLSLPLHRYGALLSAERRPSRAATARGPCSAAAGPSCAPALRPPFPPPPAAAGAAPCPRPCPGVRLQWPPAG